MHVDGQQPEQEGWPRRWRCGSGRRADDGLGPWGTENARRGARIGAAVTRTNVRGSRGDEMPGGTYVARPPLMAKGAIDGRDPEPGLQGVG